MDAKVLLLIALLAPALLLAAGIFAGRKNARHDMGNADALVPGDHTFSLAE
jgi:hypothetical protein